jgi:hypothetical protein
MLIYFPKEVSEIKTYIGPALRAMDFHLDTFRQ